MTELCVQLEQRSAKVEHSGVTEPGGINEFTKPVGLNIPVPESTETASGSAPEFNSSEEDTSVKDSGKSIDAKRVVRVMSNSSLVSDDTGEIVQIPLDDNEVQDSDSHDDDSNVENDVPITDAPLIGAPFRLISFVAKYVSGADLVEQTSSNTAR